MEVDSEEPADRPGAVPRPSLVKFHPDRAGLPKLTKEEQIARRSVRGEQANPAALASGNAKMEARQREFDRLAAMSARPKSRARTLATGSMGS
jgi:hypothetical protein